MTQKKDIGKIGWLDLTVSNAEEVKNFYCEVTGWNAAAVPVADYEDFCVSPPSSNSNGSESEPVAGICHKKGANATQPSQWLMYINVENLDRSLADCKRLGGDIVVPPRDMGSYGQVAVIADPAGAVVALIETPE